MKRMIAALALSLTLAACAGAGPAPVYADPFQGLLNQSSSTVPIDRPITVQQPIGLIFSNNVETWFRYVSKGQESAKAWGSLTNYVVVADVDPHFVASRVVAMLKVHYPNIELVQDFNEAIATGKKSICLVDMQPVSGGVSGGTTTVDITAFFFDAKMQPVTKMSGHGSGVVPYPAWDIRLQPSTDAAVAQLDQKISALVR